MGGEKTHARGIVLVIFQNLADHGRIIFQHFDAVFVLQFGFIQTLHSQLELINFVGRRFELLLQ